MSPLLLETIKCQDGNLFHLDYHQARFNLARINLFARTDKIDLSDFITIPKELQTGFYRCRVIYSESIKKVEFIPHEYRDVNRLKIIESNEIDYQFKYSDRKKLTELFEKRGDCDDILIVKNGYISDSFTANPIFFDGEKWWTSDTPLLPGTQRARLLSEGKIFMCKITPSDFTKYQKVGLINALQDLKEMPVIDIDSVYF